MKLQKTAKILIIPFLLLFVTSVVSVAPVDSENMQNKLKKEDNSLDFLFFNKIRRENRISLNHFKIIKFYSKYFGLDYKLVLALIKQESQFNPYAVSFRGARGLMQIMPSTNAEIVEKLNMKHTNHLEANINAGVYYFSQLLDLFNARNQNDRIRLALAAYNAGPSRIYDAQKVAAYIGENPNSWASIETVLPLLSKRYYSLHTSIWENGKPQSGYFNGWKQTVNYVENTMSFYRHFRSLVN